MKNDKEKHVSFWVVLLFIIKISFIGFGGGNAMFPIIKKEAVDKHKWITSKELDNIVITTNMLPGASVPEAISYISISVLGKAKGIAVTVLGLIPHIMLFFALFALGIEFVPMKYLNIIYVAVMPVIIATLIHFVIRYIKQSKKELTYTTWIMLFSITTIFCLFVPTPFNIAAFVIVGVIIFGVIYEIVRYATTIKILEPIRNEIDFDVTDIERLMVIEIGKEEIIKILSKYFIGIKSDEIGKAYTYNISDGIIFFKTCKGYDFIKELKAKEVNND
ncbi:MAG: chromate transporter [Mycoplasma sp.]